MSIKAKIIEDLFKVKVKSIITDPKLNYSPEVIAVDRKKLKHSDGMILGIPGEGKAFFIGQHSTGKVYMNIKTDKNKE